MLDAEGPDSARHRWGRWLPLGLLAVLAVFAIMPVLRTQLDRSSVRRLQNVWAERTATHNALFVAVTALDQSAAPQDADLVRRTVAALQREDADRLHRLARQAAGARGFGAAHQLSNDVRGELVREATALLAAAGAGRRIDAVQLAATTGSRRVDTDLVALRRRLHVTPPSAPAVSLHADDLAQQRLSRLVDVPLPVRLLVRDGGDPSLLDLATNRVVPRPELVRVTDVVVVGGNLVSPGMPDSYVVALAGGSITAISVPASSVWAAGSGRVWLAEGRTAVLADVASGRVLRRVTAPGAVNGAVPTGLVLFDGQQLSVWDPYRMRTVRRLAGCSQLLGSQGDLVIAEFCPGDAGSALHVIDTATGQDRLMQLPAGEYHVTSATLAPDRQHVAVVLISADGAGQLLMFEGQGAGVIVQTVGGAADVHIQGRPVWTADSRRLFFTAAGSSARPAASLYTYAPEQPVATAIRFVQPGPVTVLAVLP